MQFSRAILFICYVVVNLANAQQLRFEQFTTKDGLLSDEVYNLHQDKRGYIWAFTKYGAMKYTGSAFVPVLRNLPWKESVIYAIYENPAGRKWIANSNKNIYEIVHDSAFKVPGTEICSKLIRQKTNEIVKLFVDDSLHLYVQTTLRSYKLHKEKNGRYSLFDLNTQWRKVDDCDEHVIAIGSTYMSVPFIHPVSGNFDLVSRHIRFHSESGPLKDPGISIKTSLRVKHCKRFGRVWYLSFSDQIFRINPDGTWREKKIDGFVLNFIKDRRGHLWIASYRGGLLEFDENDSLLHQYFPGKTVHDVLPDNHNGLWVSTDGAGIYHCRNIDELHYEESTALGKPVNFMRQIGERLFIATTDQRLFCIYKGRVVPLPKAQTKIADDPQGIYCRDSLYLVSYRIHYERLELHPSGKFVVEKTASETSNHVPVYFVDGQNSSLLFMGRNRVGLLQDITRLSGSKPFALKNVLISQKALCVLKHGSDLLVGTDQGVFVFRNDSLVRPGYLQATEHLSVTRIVEDRDGNVWFCTKGNGLIKMRPNRDLVNYSSSSGMASDIINDISFVGKNGVLISCNRGLYYYTFLPLAKHQAALRLLDGEIVCSMVFDGKIYVGTKNGLVTIDARSLQPLPSAFFNLSSVWINGESKAENRLCKLKHDENNLKFCFDVIRFSQGSSGLHYLLCSPDIDSGSVSENEINLKRLSPGDYTLTVKPAGENSQRVMSIPFSIQPAIWQQIWFVISLYIIGLLLAVVVGRYTYSYYRTKALRRSEAEKLIAEYRLIALKAQINPHFMSNCIAAIQHLILNNKVNEANEYLAKFSYLVRQVLNLSNKSLVTVKEEMEIIELYLKLEQLRFEKIIVRIQVDPSIDVSSVFIPPLLSQPIIENAIWHGLLALDSSRAPMLLISMKHEDGRIRITVEDNGVGRDADKVSLGNSRESKGIAITRQRIENLKFISGKDLASLDYEDLVHADGTPAGTRVTISLPDNLHL